MKNYINTLIFNDKVTEDLISNEIQDKVIKIGLEKIIKNKIKYHKNLKLRKIDNLKKLDRQKKIKILAFYSVIQFCYDLRTKIKLIKLLNEKKYYIFFARERLIIRNKKEFNQNYYNLIMFPITNRKLIKIIVNKVLN